MGGISVMNFVCDELGKRQQGKGICDGLVWCSGVLSVFRAPFFECEDEYYCVVWYHRTQIIKQMHVEAGVIKFVVPRRQH